jgi:osmotically-inducible protein OsmY
MLKLFAFSMALILLAASCLAADKPVSDDVIYDQVRIKLSGDPIAKGGSFTVDVKQGVVTKKVNGVKQVINNLTVAKGGK